MLEIANDTDRSSIGDQVASNSGALPLHSAHDTTCNYRHVALPQVPQRLHRARGRARGAAVKAQPSAKSDALAPDPGGATC